VYTHSLLTFLKREKDRLPSLSLNWAPHNLGKLTLVKIIFFADFFVSCPWIPLADSRMIREICYAVDYAKIVGEFKLVL
jgi:hypothetical protein